MDDLLLFVLALVLVFVAVFIFAWGGWHATLRILRKQEQWYEKVLVNELLLDVTPRSALILSGLFVASVGLVMWILLGHVMWFFVGGMVAAFVPNLVVRYLEQKRRARLDQQIVDAITTLSSGVRAGLTLVQSIDLLVNNSVPPLKQEFSQLLREYHMGLDLHQAMRNAANRISSQRYRLLFTALETHRTRGGDVGKTLDSLAESMREIERLEGRLDALTSQGRAQATMVAAMPVVLIGILYLIEPDAVAVLLNETAGRAMLLIAGVLILLAFLWIRRIMAVDI